MLLPVSVRPPQSGPTVLFLAPPGLMVVRSAVPRFVSLLVI